ncbi:MAG: hypothetical protein K2P27_09620 [Lachnospiraceae bacterium]|nr:hypothetical protein [Lachnospiraceae bacterium]
MLRHGKRILPNASPHAEDPAGPHQNRVINKARKKMQISLGNRLQWNKSYKQDKKENADKLEKQAASE